MFSYRDHYSVRRAFSGFTLADLVIALAILGLIATFTIPKIMVVQQAQQKKAIFKEIFFNAVFPGIYRQHDE